jgi:CrcB protein
MNAFFLVFLGSGLGGAARHAVNIGALRLLGSGFPHGTLIVNIAGSLILGLLAGYFAMRSDPGQAWRLFLTTGILGGFTTFSAFSLDAVLLVERGDFGLAALFVVASVGGSVAALFSGLVLMRAVL